MEELVGTSNFEDKEQEIRQTTKKTFAPFYPTYWKGIRLLKTAAALLIKENEVNKDRYVDAMLVLVSRAIQHMESMRVLVEAGLYGDAFVSSRNLTSDIAMIQYLRYKPELVEQFLTEKQDSYQDKTSDFSKNFSEGTVRKVLEENGVPPFKGTFDVLSKASHASAFGAQLYGSMGKKPGEFHLKYGPGYESIKAAGILAIAITGPFDMLDNIVLYKSQKSKVRPPEWKPIDIGMEELEEEIDIYNAASIQAVEELRKMVDATEDSQPSPDISSKPDSESTE